MCNCDCHATEFMVMGSANVWQPATPTEELATLLLTCKTDQEVWIHNIWPDGKTSDTKWKMITKGCPTQ